MTQLKLGFYWLIFIKSTHRLNVNFVKLNIFKALLYKALVVTKKSEKLYHTPCFFYEIVYNFANKTLA